RWVEARTTARPLAAPSRPLSVSPTRIVGLRHERLATGPARSGPFSIPYSDRWVEADPLRRMTEGGAGLSGSPTRIVGLRLGAGRNKPSSSRTFSIPYSDRWVEAAAAEAERDYWQQAFSIPYSDRWVEARFRPYATWSSAASFQYPLLGSLG